MPANEMIIDRQLPVFDATLAEHIVVDAEGDPTWQAVRHLDLLRVRTPLTVASMWARDLPARVSRRRRGEPGPRPEHLTFAEGLPGWVMLGEDPGHEIVVGAVGRFWTPKVEWKQVAAGEFAPFDEPGYGKIAANFSLRPYGATRTLVSYEARTATTDARSRTAFARYWTVVKPFAGHVMRATLAVVKADAEQLHAKPYPGEAPGRTPTERRAAHP